MTYRGNTLANGRVAGRLYPSGQHPQLVGACSYQTVSERPGSFDGPWVEGAYALWFPLEMKDTQFRPMNARWGWDQPYIVIVGQANSADAQNGRLRVVANWEFVTFSQKYESIPSTVNPDALEKALFALQGFPAVMPNGLHSAAIGRFLNKARGAVKSGLKVGAQLAPYAEMAAAMM
jgi:hypothetical protein